MPQFFPDHARDGADPDDSSDFSAFLRGYLACAEWLALDSLLLGVDAPDFVLSDDRRADITGWHPDAIAEARADCAEFLAAHVADLATYCEESRRDLESAGLDFWLSRNGHGAGFFDHGNHPAFDRLQDAARRTGSRECYATETQLIFDI